MSTNKEIKNKIASINSTRKITKAMEMVAASKMRKAKERMLAKRPYSESILHIIGNIASSSPEYTSKYMQERKVKKVGIIVIATDRGLCAGLNANLFRKINKEILHLKQKNIAVELCALGAKALAFCRTTGCTILSANSNLAEKPNLEEIIGAVDGILMSYSEQKIDKLILANNYFVNTVVQKPKLSTLLPLQANNNDSTKIWDYIYEPDAKTLLDSLMQRYIETLAYQGIVENYACEQAARMLAMKNASDNAADLVDDLKLVYNKNRQAAITQEIAEIVGGAASL